MNQQIKEREVVKEAQKREIPVTKKRVKYKIDYKKLSLLIGGAVLTGGLIWGGVYLFRSMNKAEYKIYDAAVQLRDGKNADPEEDAKNSAKRGDVILVREAGREWSDTEKISYLIIKIKLNQEQAQKITQAKTKKLSKKEAINKGVVNDEILENIGKEELEQMLTENVLFREYRINFDKLGLDLEKIQNEGIIPEEEFNWKVVEKK